MTDELINKLIWLWVYAGVGAALFTLAILFLAAYHTHKEKNNDREGN